MSTKIIGGYVGGQLFQWTDAQVKQVTNSGLNYVVAWEAGVSPEGEITYNFGPIANNGSFLGSSAMVQRFSLLKNSGGIKTILLSLGAGTEYSSYQNMAALGFKKGGIVYNNWKAIHDALPMIDGIDFDDEEGLSSNGEIIVEFSNMLHEIGFNQVTFCPFTQQNEWNSAYQTLQSTLPGFVTHYNLQCYSGGDGNNPVQWQQSISNAPANLVLPGLTADNSPSQITAILQGWQNNANPVEGAWLWNLDKIPVANLSSYINAISSVLTPAKPMNATAKFNIVNNSNPTVQSSSIYICIVGADPTSNAYSYVDLNSKSSTYGQLVTFTKYKSGTTSQPLSAITSPIPVPKIKSARMYFAIGSDFTATEFTPGSGPSMSQVNDGGAAVLFDFVEFDTSTADLNINSTNVDMYALSYTMQLKNSAGQEVSVGISSTRTDMMNQFNQIPKGTSKPVSGNTAWYNQLFVNDAHGKVLRFLAPQQPGYADFKSNGLDYQKQLTHYLSNYVNNEVFTPGREFSFYDKFYPSQQNKYYGQVNEDGTIMSIYTDAGMKNLYCTLNPPSNTWSNPSFPQNWHNVNGAINTIDWGFALLGNSLTSDTPNGWGLNNGADPAVMALLISICRGVAHMDNGCTDWVNPKNYFLGGKPSANFPIEYYAKTIHANGLNGLAYAFAYDDIYAQNPSVSFNTGTEITFSLNSLEACRVSTNTIDILTVVDCKAIVESSILPGTNAPGASLGSYDGSDPFIYMISSKNYLANDSVRAGSELNVEAEIGDTIRWTMTSPGAGLKYNALLVNVGIGPNGAQNSISVPVTSSRQRQLYGSLGGQPQLVNEITFTATVNSTGKTQYFISFQIVDNNGNSLGYFFWDPFITVTSSTNTKTKKALVGEPQLENVK